MTRVIVEIAKQFGIAIQGHIIVGKQGHASLKELKLILTTSLLWAKADLILGPKENIRAFIRKAISGCAHRGCTRASSRRSQRRDGTVSTDRNLIA